VSGTPELFRETSGDVVVLNGVLHAITFRNEDNGYTVARLDTGKPDGMVTIVGLMPGVQTGDTMVVTGRWTSHKVYGRQVDVQSCELRPPTGRAGLH
jgi:exodeoxyribonuclease V alpha subunit